MTLAQLADKLIPAPKNKKVLTKAQGVTRDIITEVLDCLKDDKEQLKKFAPYLKGHSITETCKNVWDFWKSNIRYQVDDEGVQWIKSPAAVWKSKFCDCKSFSVAVAGSLYCLGIPVKFRFTSYGTNTQVPTHVYVVAMDGNKQIIVDCVWTGFNSQKPYTKKWDYDMTNIYRISGIGSQTAVHYKPGQLNVDLNDPELTEAEFSIGLAIQGLELEQNIMRRTGVFGIGSTHDDGYQTLIEGHKLVLRDLFKKRKGIAPLTAEQKKAAIEKWFCKNKTAVGDIGFLKKLVKNVGKGIKKVAKGVGKGVKKFGKAVTKVVKTPARMAAQGALKNSGGFFLYLFIPKNIPINKLPQAVQVKRQKALEYKDRVVKKLQMPSKNFDQIVRNSAMQAFGNTPEAVLAQWIKQSNFKVSGLMDLATGIISKAGGVLKSLFGKLGEDLGADLEQFTPSPEDWGIVAADPATAQQYSMQMQQSSGYYGSSGGNYSGYSNQDAGYNYGSNTMDETDGNNSEPVMWQTNVDENGDTTGYTNLSTGETVPPYKKPFTGDGKNIIQEPNVEIRPTKQSVNSGSGVGLLLLGGLALLATKK